MGVIVVEVVIGGSGVIAPSDLPSLIRKVSEAVPAGGTEVIVLSGRMPVWAFVALGHYFHPRPAIATFEPRLGKGVIVASHVSEVRIGDTVDLTGAKKVVVNFP